VETTPGEPEEEEQGPLVELTPPEGIPIGSRLLMRRFGDEVGIFAGPMAVFRFNVNDKAGRQLAIATLSRMDLADDDEIAAAFGVHRNTVGRLAKKLVEGGVGALLARSSPPPPVRTTLNDEARALIAAHAATMAPKEITELIATTCGIRISVSQVRRLARAWRQEHLFDDDDDPSTPNGGGGASPELAVPGQEPGGGAIPGAGEAPSDPLATTTGYEPPMVLPVVRVPADEAQEPATTTGYEPPVGLPASVRGRHVGLALFYPALAALGLVEAARECFSLKAAERFGVRAVTLSLFFLYALGGSTVEAAKHLTRESLGALVGAGRAPCVKTLRRKLAELVPQKMAGQFLERLSRTFVASGIVGTAYLYVDGHLQVYTGKAKLAHQWSTRHRIACRGLMRYFVNDEQGRPLLFVPEALSGSLAKALPAVVEAVREILGERPFTLIFDRGGYDAKLFAWLKRQGIDFITYQKGDPALAKEAFGRREARFEGKRVRFWIAEDQILFAKTGPWRRVVVRTKSGHQTPILTSLGPEVGAARIACLMFARWRQENFFRYLRSHLGIDALVSYAFGAAPGETLIANPERKALDRLIAAKKKELAAARALLGEALAAAPATRSAGLRGLRAAESETLRAVEALEADLELLKTRRWMLATHVPLAEADTDADVALLEAKTIVDAIKIAAYNAEEWLTDRLANHYRNPHDIRDLLRNFIHLSGEITTTSAGVSVRLDAPDTPAHRRALEGLCEELNALRAPFPGTDLPVSYQVVVHQVRVAA
jgi:transposase